MSFTLLIGAATLPFVAKIGVMLLGLHGYVLQSIYKIFQLLAPSMWRYWHGAKGWRIIWPTDESLPSWKIWVGSTLISVFFFVVGITALTVLVPLWRLDPHVIRAGFDERFSVGPMTAVLVVVFLSFINSALEELHFRAWLDIELSRRIGNVGGIGISAIAFASMHAMIFFGLPGFPLSLIVVAVFGLFLCGICWSLLMRESGGIHAAWWSHGLTDALFLSWGLHWLGYV